MIFNISFSDAKESMDSFWQSNGCKIIDPLRTLDIGAATLHPYGTFYRCLHQKKSRVAFLQQCNRPEDRSNNVINDLTRSNLFFQYQVLITPFNDIDKCPIDLFKESLENLYSGFTDKFSIEVLKDDWKSPCIGAFGIGYEVRVNGLEVAQITYIQKIGGLSLSVPSLEIAYGFDRILMILNNLEDIKDVEISQYTNVKPKMKVRDIVKEKLNYKNDTVEEINLELDILFRNHPIKANNYHESYRLLLRYIHYFNSALARCNNASLIDDHSINSKAITAFSKYAKQIANLFIACYGYKLSSYRKCNIKLSDIENKKVDSFCIPISECKISFYGIPYYTFMTILKTICNDSFANFEIIGDSKIRIYTTCKVNAKIKKDCKKTIDNALSKCSYLYCRSKEFNYSCPQDPNDDMYLFLSTINVSISTNIEAHKKIYTFIKVFSNSIIAKEYGDNSEMFDILFTALLYDHFTVYEDIGRIFNTCKIIYLLSKIGKDNNNTQFYKRNISGICTSIKYLYDNYHEQSANAVDHIIRNSREYIKNGNILGVKIFDDIKAHLSNLICSKHCKLINRMSNNILDCYDIHANNMIKKIYEINCVHKRLAPKITQLSQENKDFFNLKNTNYSMTFSVKDLEALAKPLSEYTEIEKVTLSQASSYLQRISMKYNLVHTLPDIIRLNIDKKVV